MALLKDTRTAPPGGWVYLQSETGLRMTEPSPGELIATVIRHRTYKGITPLDADDVWRDIQRQLCEKLGNNFCRPEPGDGG